jgi:hypothetical protein
MYDLHMKITADLIMQKGIVLVGTPDQVAEQILRIKQTCSYEDFFFTAWFEGGGYRTEEVEEQMHLFAEQVMPVLRRECGSGPALPDSTVHLVPEPRTTGTVTRA